MKTVFVVFSLETAKYLHKARSNLFRPTLGGFYFKDRQMLA